MKTTLLTPSFVLLAATASVIAAPSPAPILGEIKSNTKHHFSPGKECGEPKHFTSAFTVRATPDQIVTNDGSKPAGQPDAVGRYQFRINSKEEIICWDIELTGVTGEYMSPARTATHIHQAAKGAAGPPRIAFPNPEKVGQTSSGAELRRSSGCAQGPFVTGLNAANTTTDTGSASGFKLADIEKDGGAGFFADVHTKQFLAGVVRGQLIPSEREVKSPRKFTSVIKTTAKPDMVIGTDGKPVAGQKGAKGEYELKINTHEDTVCYKIVLDGMTGDYFAPAKTATHVHEGASGATGPPRLAFKNPQSSKWSKWGWNKNRRTSEACIKGPFSTGLTGADGKDTGSQSGFTLEQLEKNPKGFFADTHTVRFAAGVVRGQLRRHRKH